MAHITLEKIIRNHVPLSYKKNARGWEPVLCRICNDRGHKGPRAAFNFEGDGVAYNCFNCGHKATYHPADPKGISSKMETVLNSFGIPEQEWQVILLSHLENHKRVKNSTTVDSSYPNEIPMPSSFYYLKDAKSDDKWATVAKWYLKEVRNIEPNTYPFMLSRKTEKLAKWVGRLIIPIFYQNRLIFYQGRSLLPTTKKYESPSVPKDKIIFDLDKLFDGESPIYIVEGWFDAFAINGFAVFGNQLSKHQINLLNKSPRPKIVIPDKFGNGESMGSQALNLGWSISLPEIGDCKDMDEAVRRFGLLFVQRSLIQQTMSGLEANVALRVWCRK